MVQEIAVLAQQLLSYAPMDLFLLENQFWGEDIYHNTYL